MAEMIKCPVCGENTSKEFEFCQYCQSRLQPLTGSLKGENAPIKPGQLPTKKSTAELETVLPQWLRDARQSARDAAPEDETPPQPKQPKPSSSPRPSAPQDLLAGLQSQTGDDEEDDEIPDWLSNLTGDAPSPKKQKDESSNMRWVDLGGSKPAAQEPESDVPSWMQSKTPFEESGTPQQPAAESQEWQRQIPNDSASAFPSADSSDVPDWMRQIDAADSGTQNNDALFGSLTKSFDSAPAASADDTSDWLRSLGAEDSGTHNDAMFGSPATSFDSAPAAPAASGDTPDWLRSLGAEDSGAQNNDALFGSPATSFDSAPAAPAASGETPDWLRSLGAEDSGTQNNDTLFGSPATSFDSAPAASAADDTSDWLKSLGAEDSGTQNNDAMFGSPATSFDSAPAAPAASGDTPDWLRSLDVANAGAQNNDASAVPDTSDWLKSLDAPTGAVPTASDTPDWLSSLGEQSATAPAASDATDWLASLDKPSASAPAASDTPDWLASLDKPSAVAPAASDTPDWLSTLGEQSAAAPAASDAPDWLNSLGEQNTAAPATSDTPDWLNSAGGQNIAAPVTSDTPDWLSGLGSQTPASPASMPQEDKTLGDDVPSWLQAAAPQSTTYDELSAAQPAVPAASSDTPDWLSSLPQSTPAAEPESLPKLAPNSNLGGSTDSLFTDMPDWLSNTADSPAPSEVTESPAEGTIEASQLPAWVQAMRPVEAVVSDLSLSPSQTLEARGALAGLQGVLPAVPGYAPTSKPKAYSLKLHATDEQLSQAILLEQILTAETSPVPIASFSPLRSSRSLRWALASIFLAVTFAVLLLGTQIFSLPVGMPLEIDGAMQTVGAIPDNAPVLVAFDYEPARVGEMEAAAAPIFDQMVLLRHPRLSLISTTETGAVLAERFMMTGPLAQHNYQSGSQYVNLGYLPGGQMGIRAFTQNPSDTAPFDVTFTQAWKTPALEGVSSFSNFAAFIIVTDNADSARAWIEQMTTMNVSIPVVVVSSAQSTPMIQPYYASGQIKGLVSGLYGGAIFEQANAGRPGTTRVYWDAYSIGMLLAMALIVFGGLWNMFQGTRERAAAREAK